MIFNTLVKTIKSILVVFCVLIAASCVDQKSSELEIIYISEKAVAITFPSSLATLDAKVYLKTNLDTSILGDFSSNESTHKFEPIVPFFEGNTYLLYQNDKEVSRFIIRAKKEVLIPEVIAIYPSINQVPENLLKMYFLFSKPMQEVYPALNYITVTENDTGNVVDVFLELNTELWNKEHTQLTLWLDPGRIKTDLIPNKEKGLPLIKGTHYTVTIDQNFKDANSNLLKKTYTKEFTVVARDFEKPVPTNWELIANLDEVTLHFKEPMDAILAKETFHIKNSANEYVIGDFELINKEKTLKFYPKHPFALGVYTFIIETRLEDLAGNNLNHPFDNDLNKLEKQEFTEIKKLQFIIK